MVRRPSGEITTLRHFLLLQNKTIFSNLQKIYKLTLAIPISSATCERNFSVPRKVKSGSEH